MPFRSLLAAPAKGSGGTRDNKRALHSMQGAERILNYYSWQMTFGRFNQDYEIIRENRPCVSPFKESQVFSTENDIERLQPRL